MSLSLSPANQNAPRARAWRENDRYKRANAQEISDLLRSFHAIVEVQFGGLVRLDHTANNYKENLNSLYRHPDLTLTIDKALHNIIVSAYSHYIDSWPMNGACVGHRAILMRSMLQFAMHYGQYRHRQ